MLLTPDIVPTVASTGASARVAVRVAPRFRVGDRVRVRNHNPTTHTRLPGYLRGKLGTIEQDYGVFVFPDTHAHGQGEKPQHCYSVRFTARELWGPTASDRDTLRVDVFDDYMDLGEEGIDNDLLVSGGEQQIVEMNNGCICCTVRGDLVRTLGDLRQRREAKPDAFDRVIIETTGLADPAPVAQTFFIDDDIAAYYALDAIVTVVDAKHAERQLDEFHEAQEQVGFADRILLSKSDLVGEGERARLQERLARINRRAPVKPVNFGETPIADLLDIKGFSLDAILEIEPGFLGEDGHEHDDGVQSFVFTSARPFDQRRLQDFFRDTIANHAKDLMRYKGILAFDGVDHQVVIQGVHMIMGSDLGRAWAPGERRDSKLVFIGRGLPKAELVQRLERCLVA